MEGESYDRFTLEEEQQMEACAARYDEGQLTVVVPIEKATAKRGTVRVELGLNAWLGGGGGKWVDLPQGKNITGFALWPMSIILERPAEKYGTIAVDWGLNPLSVDTTEARKFLRVQKAEITLRLERKFSHNIELWALTEKPVNAENKDDVLEEKTKRCCTCQKVVGEHCIQADRDTYIAVADEELKGRLMGYVLWMAYQMDANTSKFIPSCEEVVKALCNDMTIALLALFEDVTYSAIIYFLSLTEMNRMRIETVYELAYRLVHADGVELLHLFVDNLKGRPHVMESVTLDYLCLQHTPVKWVQRLVARMTEDQLLELYHLQGLVTLQSITSSTYIDLDLKPRRLPVGCGYTVPTLEPCYLNPINAFPNEQNQEVYTINRLLPSEVGPAKRFMLAFIQRQTEVCMELIHMKKWPRRPLPIDQNSRAKTARLGVFKKSKEVSAALSRTVLLYLTVMTVNPVFTDLGECSGTKLVNWICRHVMIAVFPGVLQTTHALTLALHRLSNADAQRFRQVSSKPTGLNPEQAAIGSVVEPRFSLLSGAGGIGKTYVVGCNLTSVVTFIAEEAEKPLKVVIAAPTHRAKCNAKSAIGKQLRLETKGVSSEAPCRYAFNQIESAKPEAGIEQYDVSVSKDWTVTQAFGLNRDIGQFMEGTGMIVVDETSMLSLFSVLRVILAAYGIFGTKTELMRLVRHDTYDDGTSPIAKLLLLADASQVLPVNSTGGAGAPFAALVHSESCFNVIDCSGFPNMRTKDPHLASILSEMREAIRGAPMPCLSKWKNPAAMKFETYDSHEEMLHAFMTGPHTCGLGMFVPREQMQQWREQSMMPHVQFVTWVNTDAMKLNKLIGKLILHAVGRVTYGSPTMDVLLPGSRVQLMVTEGIIFTALDAVDGEKTNVILPVRELFIVLSDREIKQHDKILNFEIMLDSGRRLMMTLPKAILSTVPVPFEPAWAVSVRNIQSCSAEHIIAVLPESRSSPTLYNGNHSYTVYSRLEVSITTCAIGSVDRSSHGGRRAPPYQTQEEMLLDFRAATSRPRASLLQLSTSTQEVSANGWTHLSRGYVTYCAVTMALFFSDQMNWGNRAVARVQRVMMQFLFTTSATKTRAAQRKCCIDNNCRKSMGYTIDVRHACPAALCPVATTDQPTWASDEYSEYDADSNMDPAGIGAKLEALLYKQELADQHDALHNRPNYYTKEEEDLMPWPDSDDYDEELNQRIESGDSVDASSSRSTFGHKRKPRTLTAPARKHRRQNASTHENVSSSDEDTSRAEPVNNGKMYDNYVDEFSEACQQDARRAKLPEVSDTRSESTRSTRSGMAMDYGSTRVNHSSSSSSSSSTSSNPGGWLAQVRSAPGTAKTQMNKPMMVGHATEKANQEGAQLQTLNRSNEKLQTASDLALFLQHNAHY